MRIALIAGTYRPEHCGVADYTAQLRQAFIGQAETILLTTYEAAQAQTSASASASIHGVVSDWDWGNLWPLVRAIHATQADLLHIQHAAGTYSFNRAIFLLLPLLKLSGWRAPVVTTLHEYGWWEWQPWYLPPAGLEWFKVWGQARGWWDREAGFLLTQSDAVIVTNSSAEAVIQTRLPHLKPHRIPIAANVATSPLARPIARQQLRQRYSWDDQTQIIAFFGFLHPVKGLETLLCAFQKLVAQYPQARLLLIGGVESLALPEPQASAYWKQLQQQIKQLGLEGVVKMTGYLSPIQVSESLLGADLGVLPFNHGVTLKSGSLLALLAHGLPTVATRAQPPDPALENLPSLRLIAPRQVEELTVQLGQLLDGAQAGGAQVDSTQVAQEGQLDSIRTPLNQLNQLTWPQIAELHLQIYQAVYASY
jgi:polysaccharide biosynthesis protein PslF